VYTLNQNVSIANTGNYTIPVTATYSNNPSSCDISLDGTVDVNVIAAPTPTITLNYTGCINNTATYTAGGSTSNGVAFDRWNWNFGDNTNSTTQNPVKNYASTGTFSTTLQAIAVDGCVGNDQKSVTVNPLPTASLVKDSLAICSGDNASFAISNPAGSATYSWYDVATGGTALTTGTSFTSNNNTAYKNFYVGVMQNNCPSLNRVKAVVYIKPYVVAPTATADSVGMRTLRFTWNSVPNATGYEVSTDDGAHWTAPSSGNMGLSHTITGLPSFTTIKLKVRTKGDCNNAPSQEVVATTLADKVFVPNTFTPNNDGLNDVLKVYVTGAKDVKLSVFNQWGEKVYESNSLSAGWDGTYKGKKQPSGIYIYVCRVVLDNGEVIEKKGSVNLVR
jgi:gliding motility-associated-like protein